MTLYYNQKLCIKFYAGKKEFGFVLCAFQIGFHWNLADPTKLVLIVIVHFGLYATRKF